MKNQANARPSSIKAIGAGHREKYLARRGAIHFALWLRRAQTARQKLSYPQIVYLLIRRNNRVEFIISHVFVRQRAVCSFLLALFPAISVWFARILRSTRVLHHPRLCLELLRLIPFPVNRDPVLIFSTSVSWYTANVEYVIKF